MAATRYLTVAGASSFLMSIALYRWTKALLITGGCCPCDHERNSSSAARYARHVWRIGKPSRTRRINHQSFVDVSIGRLHPASTKGEERAARVLCCEHSEYEQFRDALPVDERALLIFEYWTGCRFGEIAQPESAQVDRGWQNGNPMIPSYPRVVKQSSGDRPTVLKGKHHFTVAQSAVAGRNVRV